MVVNEIFPDADAAALADRIEAGLSRRQKDLSSAAHRVRSGSDPEAIHDLRVAARRLIAVLRVWEGLFRARERRLAVRELRNLRRRLGEARELEVHVALLEARIHTQAPLTQAAIAVVLGRMNDRLSRRRRRAAKRARPKRLKRLMRLLDGASTELRRKLFANSRAFERAHRMTRELEEGTRAAFRNAGDQPDEGALHGARLAVKKWRYGLECLDEAVSGAARPQLKALREIQEALGTSQDRTTLLDVLARYRVSGPDPNPLQPLVDELEAERQSAVERFQRLRAAWQPPLDTEPLPEAAGAESAGSALWRPEERERMARWLTGRRRGG